jgi:hypothetical protein
MIIYFSCAAGDDGFAIMVPLAVSKQKHNVVKTGG